MDQAEQPIRNAIRLDPDNASAHYFLARLLYTDGRLDEAIEESQKGSFRLRPASFGPMRTSDYAMKENTSWNKERSTGISKQSMWKQRPTKRRSGRCSILRTLLIRENRLAEAKPYLVQALQINPTFQALVQMGTLLERTGDLKGALDNYRAAIGSEHSNLQPGLASAYYKAALICKKLGYTDEATKDFDKFHEVHDKH